jgi:hypothetical protein
MESRGAPLYHKRATVGTDSRGLVDVDADVVVDVNGDGDGDAAERDLTGCAHPVPQPCG